MNVSRVVQLIGRFILGGVFIYASINKIAFPKEFARIVMNYHILPNKLAIYFAFLLPWIELIAGIFLLVGLFIRESALALSSLLLVFMAATIIRSLNGTLENCGCFSVFSTKSENIIFIIGRNTFLILCGITLLANRINNKTMKNKTNYI